MANRIQVSTSQLRAKATELRSKNNTFKTYYTNLQNIESRLNGMWEGDAKKNFHTAFHNDIVQMQNFHDLIEKYVQALTQIAQKYEAAERKNAATASTRTYK